MIDSIEDYNKVNYCHTVEPNKEKYCPYCGNKLPWAKDEEVSGYTTWAGSPEVLEEVLKEKNKNRA